MATMGLADRPFSSRPAEQAAEHRQHADRARDRRGDGHGEGVAILHVAQLMAQHAHDLLAAQMAQQAGVHRDRGMLGAAAGGEGVGLVLVDDVDPRHRQAGAAGSSWTMP